MLITYNFCEITALEPSPPLESDALTKLLCKKPPNTMTSSLANTATGMYSFLKFVKNSKLNSKYLPQMQLFKFSIKKNYFDHFRKNTDAFWQKNYGRR